MKKIHSRIDNYAQSMFRFEYLNDNWIDRCASYLNLIFSDRIKGRIVIDYAFGRGNWALAFLVAGAQKVIAIDAAESNVRKLSDYARDNVIDRLEVIHGNIQENPIQVSADILWVYGILHHIFPPEPFLNALSELARDDNAESLLYSYNTNSLRQIIVEIARKGHVYRDYEEFVEDSILFNPAARMRARDDLTAPCVQFYSAPQLWKMADKTGHAPIGFVRSFQESEGLAAQEFNPHHLQCRLSKQADKNNVQSAPAQEDILPIDLRIIKEFGDCLMAVYGRAQSKKLAIGLINTHFSALENGGYERCLQDDFLYLLYAYLAQGLTAQTNLQKLILDLSFKALRGESGRPGEQLLAESAIARRLIENRIRI